MVGEVVVQKLARELESNMQLAIKYYSIISVLFDLYLTKKQIQLLAFTSIRGTITPLPARKEFIRLFKSSLSSIENIKGSLKKRKLLVDSEGMYRVHPRIALDFSKDMTLQINFSNKQNSGE